MDFRSLKEGGTFFGKKKMRNNKKERKEREIRAICREGGGGKNRDPTKPRQEKGGTEDLKSRERGGIGKDFVLLANLPGSGGGG